MADASGLPSARIDWIDWLKALGVFAVVFGHIASNSILIPWIYSFHMPLFFAVSGYLLKPDLLSASFGRFVRQTGGRLLPAYLFFGGLGLAHTFVLASTGQATGSAVADTTRSFIGLLLGTDRWPQYPLVPIVLWFLPALFLSQVIVFTVFKIKPVSGRWIAITICLAAGILSSRFPTPWSLGSACVALPFMVLGHSLRQGSHWERRLVSLPWGAGLLAIAIGSMPAWWGHSLDLRSTAVDLPWLVLPSAVLTLGGLVRLTHGLDSNRLVKALSRRSLSIFALHSFVIWGIDTMSRLAGLNLPSTGHGDLTSWIKTSLVITGCALAHSPIEKFLFRFR
jgi:acyltransferase